MNQDFRKTEDLLEKASKTVNLSGTEKNKVRNFLEQKIAEPSLYTKISSLVSVRYILAPVMITLLISGGVLQASADSLPGQLLYPLKVDVYEPLVGFSHFDPQEKVSYQKTLTERRLSELVELGSRGDLDPERERKILALIDRHHNGLMQESKELALAEQISVESEVESLFKAHENILSGLNRTAVQQKIQERVALAVRSRKEAEVKLGISNSSELEKSVASLRKEAEDAINSAKNSIGGSNDRLALQAESQISLAEQESAEADLNTEAGAYTRAIGQYQKAKSLAKEAEVNFDLGNKYAVGLKEITDDQIAKLEEKTELAARVVIQEEPEMEQTPMAEINLYTYFENRLQDISGGNTVRIYLNTFPSLQKSDFNGISSGPGIYQFVEGSLILNEAGGLSTQDLDNAIDSEGHTILLLNIATRLGIELSGVDSVNLIIERISTQETLDVLPEL